MRSPEQSREDNAKKKVKVAYLVSHPIQYQAPLLRRIAQEPDIELTVFFGSNFSVQEYVDKGFGVDVKWDVPLLDGYRYEFLPAIWDKRRTGPTSQLNYGIFSRLRGSRERDGFDVLWVHGYSTLNTLQGMLIAKALGIPVLLRAESRLGRKQNGALKQLAKRLFFSGLKQLVDGVLPIGSLNAAYWRHAMGENLPQFMMPYAVDNEYFQSRSREADLRRGDLQRELGLDASRPVILFASKLQRRKRCEDLIRAYLSLCSKVGSEPTPYLLIVGDGEERAALERLVSQSGVSGVRFCGFRNQSELPGFFYLASVFVLPSQDEPWGLIVNEVMNSGRAVILSDDVGCQPDLVTDGVEGCVFPVGNVKALTEALRRVLERPETAATMGGHGLKRISGWSYEEDIAGLRRAIAAVTRRLST
ncbi:glycosyltransferase family 4 protein [Tunturiibacter gelidoferens]|uniref:Glycosyltransferase involved in cell wall biosynthesis n=1 Tax=Tunturiibacter lichenicola TaxID=2051959 RepID=A0A7Y9NNH2_9BACT|nr:glycosyltransferase family 4 protein [Edaphobacter lichenicola]NYF52412.1 glycosyltransferase involved in cell wall biosynthesis [Edaphobacter lichenicola]